MICITANGDAIFTNCRKLIFTLFLCMIVRKPHLILPYLMISG